MRESPALKIIELLRERGGDVRYHDPHVPELTEQGLRSVGLDEALDGADLAVIVTAHPAVDHGAVVERAPQVLDLRGTTRHLGVTQLWRTSTPALREAEVVITTRRLLVAYRPESRRRGGKTTVWVGLIPHAAPQCPGLNTSRSAAVMTAGAQRAAAPPPKRARPRSRPRTRAHALSERGHVAGAEKAGLREGDHRARREGRARRRRIVITGTGPRRDDRADRADRLRQLGHDDPPAVRPARRPAVRDDARRRRVAVEAADAARDRAARADGRDDHRAAAPAPTSRRRSSSVRPTGPLRALDYALPMASAQVKTAILLAGLYADGATRSPSPARAAITPSACSRTSARRSTVAGRTTTIERAAGIAGSPARASRCRAIRRRRRSSSPRRSSPGAREVRLPNVCVNPTRTGFLDAIAAMGGAGHARGSRATRAPSRSRRSSCAAVARELRGDRDRRRPRGALDRRAADPRRARRARARHDRRARCRGAARQGVGSHRDDLRDAARVRRHLRGAPRRLRRRGPARRPARAGPRARRWRSPHRDGRRGRGARRDRRDRHRRRRQRRDVVSGLRRRARRRSARRFAARASRYSTAAS